MFFSINPYGPRHFKNQSIFGTLFLTISTIAHSFVTVICRNFIFTAETLKQIGFQKTRSHWLFVKRFGMSLGIEVEKFVKNVRENQQFSKLGDPPAPRGSQWGLVVIPMFCPSKCPIQPCTSQIFSLAEVASPGAIFRKSWKNFLRGRRGHCPFRNPTSTF